MAFLPTADQPWLKLVYKLLGPDAVEARQYVANVAQQFDAQDRWYRDRYEQASFDVVLVAGEPGGRL